MPEQTYYAAPPGWTLESPNPFSPDGSYGESWSCFLIDESLDENYIHGRLDNGLFRFRSGASVENLEARFADFLRYEPQHGRSVIVSLPHGMDVDAYVTQSLESNPPGSYNRNEDLRWLSHSTDMEAWNQIQDCGELRCLARLQREGDQKTGLGITQLREPDDYAEHVMLGLYENIGGEHVVASRAKGEIYTVEDAPYTPGVRLYFDGYKIIQDNLAAWDGLHTLKVRDHLPLAPYLIATITTRDIDPEGITKEWTPRKFLDAANEHFHQIIEEVKSCQLKADS